MSWGEPQTSWEKSLRCMLMPLATVYALVVNLRNWLYSRGIFSIYRAPVPVISVGNITVGGTGKTPITIDLARSLVEQGKKVAILSRGYRRKSCGTTVVSDGRRILCSAYESGDEPYLIAQSVPQAVVIAGARRTLSAQLAVKSYGADLLLLDDAFQHRALGRSCDVVLIDYHRDLQKDCLLPAGRLREPLSEIARANRVIITRIPHRPDAIKLQNLVDTIARLAPNATQYQCRFVPLQLVSLFTGKIMQPGELKGLTAVAFCGIATGRHFFQQLQDLGVQSVIQQEYPDHHWYSQADLFTIKSDLKKSGANLIVTTAKDAVRLEALMSGIRRAGNESTPEPINLTNLPWWYLEIGVEWISDTKPIASVYAKSQS